MAEPAQKTLTHRFWKEKGGMNTSEPSLDDILHELVPPQSPSTLFSGCTDEELGPLFGGVEHHQFIQFSQIEYKPPAGETKENESTEVFFEEKEGGSSEEPCEDERSSEVEHEDSMMNSGKDPEWKNLFVPEAYRRITSMTPDQCDQLIIAKVKDSNSMIKKMGLDEKHRKELSGLRMRYRNRVAAQRCRSRKNRYISDLEMDNKQLKQQNTDFAAALREVNQENRLLKQRNAELERRLREVEARRGASRADPRS